MNKRPILFFLIAMAFLSACGTTKTVQAPAPSPSSKPGRTLSEEERINLQYMFVNANKEKILGNYEKAAELFAQCIRIDGSNYASMFELSQIYREQKKYSDAIFFAEGAALGDPSNEWYRMFYADLLVESRKLPEAEKQFQALYRDYPDRIEFGYSYAGTLLMNGKTQEAIKVYDEIEKKTGITEELIQDKQRLYLRMGNVDKAAGEVEKLIRMNPGEMRYYSMLTDIYQVNEMPEKALETINRMKEINPNSPHVYLALAEYYRKSNEKSKSFDQLKLAFGSQELEVEIKVRIISSYLPLIDGNPEMLDQGTQLSRILAETHPGDAVSLAIYGDFLSVNQQFAEAQKQYTASIELDDKNFSVWQQLFICQSQTDDYSSMLKYSEEALTLFPDQAIVYYFNGIALQRSGRHADAIKGFTTGSKLVVDNDDLLFRIFAGLGESYNEIKNYPESDNYFEKALKIYPDEPLVLNNYSYFLSERGENLERAEAMSKKSNEIRPGQSSFEDTYGWILYKMGRLDDAKIWLQKALEHGGASSGTILEHMGDLHFRQGNINAAMEYWNKAKAAGGAGELLDKKLRDQKLYE